MEGKLFEGPKNDANKARKDIAVEFLNLIALGRPKDGEFSFTYYLPY